MSNVPKHVLKENGNIGNIDRWINEGEKGKEKQEVKCGQKEEMITIKDMKENLALIEKNYVVTCDQEGGKNAGEKRKEKHEVKSGKKEESKSVKSAEGQCHKKQKVSHGQCEKGTNDGYVVSIYVTPNHGTSVNCLVLKKMPQL